MQTTTYKLNVTPGGVPLTIHISQYDVGLRQYTFQPYTNVGEFSYVSGATVTLEATKPDGYAVIHSCTYNQDGSITYTVQAQLAAKPGRVWSKVVIRNGNNVLGTGAILWVVDYAGVKDDAIISDSDISALQQWMDDVEDYAEQADGSAQAAASAVSLAEAAVTSAQEAATQAAGYVDQAVILGGTPLVAATVSAMSNHDRVYVYTGSESGYTAGNWYYWNGSAWTSGGIYNSSAVQTDPTLSVSGMAADAAATGELKNDLNAVKSIAMADFFDGVEWEIGSLRGEDGQESTSTTRLRSKYIDVSSVGYMWIVTASGYKYWMYFYDESYGFLSSDGTWRTKTPVGFIPPVGTRYIRVLLANTSNTNVDFTYPTHYNFLYYAKSVLKNMTWIPLRFPTVSGTGMYCQITYNEYAPILIKASEDSASSKYRFWINGNSAQICEKGVVYRYDTIRKGDSQIQLSTLDGTITDGHLTLYVNIASLMAFPADEIIGDFIAKNTLKKANIHTSVRNGVGLSEQNGITILDFNVKSFTGLNADISIITDIVQRYEPDIVFLQEYAGTISGINIYSSVFKMYPYHTEYTELPAPVAIISKIPLSNITKTLFTTQQTGGENRGFIRAEIVLNHDTIALYTTHLEILPTIAGSRDTRIAQAAELKTRMTSDRYAILGGDLNTADCENTSGADYIGVIKPFVDENMHSVNATLEHGFMDTLYNGNTVADSTTIGCYDHIISTYNIDVVGFCVDKQKINPDNATPIDHLPLVAYLRVNG